MHHRGLIERRELSCIQNSKLKQSLGSGTSLYNTIAKQSPNHLLGSQNGLWHVCFIYLRYYGIPLAPFWAKFLEDDSQRRSTALILAEANLLTSVFRGPNIKLSQGWF